MILHIFISSILITDIFERISLNLWYSKSEASSKIVLWKGNEKTIKRLHHSDDFLLFTSSISGSLFNIVK